jgi:uncharacterized protein YjbI with pentapeptide repeats
MVSWEWIEARLAGLDLRGGGTRRCAWALGGALAVGTLIVCRPALLRNWSHWKVAHRGEGARLAGSDLAAMDLSRLSLKRADLSRACLARTRCFDTDFRHADLRRTDLRDALLAGADLRGAQLDGARLERAVYDGKTRWPSGFSPQKHGAVCANWNASIWQVFGRPASR